MADDLIRYDILAQDALRGVLRKVLAEVAKAGLPGDHHFYIAFATKAPGVRISTRLLAQYPEDMTIVIQHEFWDLSVSEHAFEVGLSFKGVPERLLIPFSAVKVFADPSVKFQLDFMPAPAKAAGEVAETAAEPRKEKAEIAAVPAAKGKALKEAKPILAKDAAKPAPAKDPADKPAGEAQIVSLDAFRKKS